MPGVIWDNGQQGEGDLPPGEVSILDNIVQELLIDKIEPFEYLIYIVGIDGDFDALEQSLMADAFNQSYSLVRSNPTVMEVELASQEFLDEWSC